MMNEPIPARDLLADLYSHGGPGLVATGQYISRLALTALTGITEESRQEALDELKSHFPGQDLSVVARMGKGDQSNIETVYLNFEGVVNVVAKFPTAHGIDWGDSNNSY